MAIETRDVGSFHAISFYAYGDVTIRQGEEEGIKIEADESVLDKLETRVDDEVLIIRLKADWLDYMNHILMSGLRGIPIRYEIMVQELDALKIFGAASVDIPELQIDTFSLLLGGAGSIQLPALTGSRFKVDLRGAGSITAAGRVMDQHIVVAGAGSYAGRNLVSERANVALRGAGSATVHASDELEVELRGLGSVTYYGQPDLRKTISGLGEISHGGE